MIMMLEENISLRVDHLFRALYSSSSVFKSNYYNHKGIKGSFIFLFFESLFLNQ